MTEEGAKGQRVEEVAALERFVIDNDDLLALEARIGRFNIFDALQIGRVEIRHSNFLAFILDPAESHGQGQVFLKAFLMDLLKEAPSGQRPLSPIELDGTDLRGVQVRREWRHIDLLITCQEPRFAVVIENKVGAQEHSDQLNRYRATMKTRHPDLPCLYVFLTSDAVEASEDDWMAYSYEAIHRVLKRVRDAYPIGGEVLVFLDHYLNLLGTRFMNDEKLDELCQKIYKSHRLALDLIWERVGKPESACLVEALKVIEQDTRWHVVHRSTNYVDFLPKAWLEWLPPVGSDEHCPLCVHFRSKETNLGYTIFVGPMKDALKRIEIVTKLRNESPGCGFKRSKASAVEGKWNRIAAIEQVLEWAEDEEPAPATVQASVKKSLEDLYPKLERLAAVLKPLCQAASLVT